MNRAPQKLGAKMPVETPTEVVSNPHRRGSGPSRIPAPVSSVVDLPGPWSSGAILARMRPNTPERRTERKENALAPLSTEERTQLEEFLEEPMIAVVATVDRHGMPQLTPNWYAYVDGRLVISTTKDRVKYRNLIHNHRLAVCICKEPLARRYAAVRGRAELRDDESIWPDTQAIVERYVDPDKVESRMRSLRRQERVIISLVPDRVVLKDF